MENLNRKVKLTAEQVALANDLYVGRKFVADDGTIKCPDAIEGRGMYINAEVESRIARNNNYRSGIVPMSPAMLADVEVPATTAEIAAGKQLYDGIKTGMGSLTDAQCIQVLGTANAKYIANLSCGEEYPDIHNFLKRIYGNREIESIRKSESQQSRLEGKPVHHAGFDGTVFNFTEYLRGILKNLDNDKFQEAMPAIEDYLAKVSEYRKVRNKLVEAMKHKTRLETETESQQ